jgi:hypothetical protein
MNVVTFERVEFRERVEPAAGFEGGGWRVAQSVGLPVGFAASRAVASVQTTRPIGVKDRLELQLRTSRNQSRWSPWMRIATWGDGAPPPRDLAAAASSPAGSVVVDQYRAGASHLFRFLQLRVILTEGLAIARLDAAARVEKLAGDLLGELPTSDVRGVGGFGPRAFSQYDFGEPGRAACSPCSIAWGAAALRGDASAGDVAACFERVRDREHGILGNWPRAIMLAGELGVPARLVYVDSLAGALAPVAAGKLMIASIGFDDPGALPGAPKPMPDGHLLVVTGFDAAAREVLTFDPARGAGDPLPHRYPADAFARVWIGRSAIAYELG